MLNLHVASIPEKYQYHKEATVVGVIDEKDAVSSVASAASAASAAVRRGEILKTSELVRNVTQLRKEHYEILHPEKQSKKFLSATLIPDII